MDLHITTPDGEADAYLTRPPFDTGSHAGNTPGVLIYQDAIGLRPTLKEMADRIASWGYTVLVPNLFYRHGPADELAPKGPLKTTEAREAFMSTAMQRVRSYSFEQSSRDTNAWIDALTHTEGVSSPVGVVGYCMGVRLAIQAAGSHPDVVRAVAGFHGGRIVTDAPDSPHLFLPSAKAEFVFGHADQDRSMPAEQVEALSHALNRSGLRAKNEIYEGAGHGYSMADTAVYNHEATERSFTEMRALFDRTLTTKQ